MPYAERIQRYRAALGKTEEMLAKIKLELIKERGSI